MLSHGRRILIDLVAVVVQVDHEAVGAIVEAVGEQDDLDLALGTAGDAIAAFVRHYVEFVDLEAVREHGDRLKHAVRQVGQIVARSLRLRPLYLRTLQPVLTLLAIAEWHQTGRRTTGCATFSKMRGCRSGLLGRAIDRAVGHGFGLSLGRSRRIRRRRRIRLRIRLLIQTVKSLPIPTPFSRPIVTPHWRRPGAYPRHA